MAHEDIIHNQVEEENTEELAVEQTSHQENPTTDEPEQNQ